MRVCARSSFAEGARSSFAEGVSSTSGAVSTATGSSTVAATVIAAPSVAASCASRCWSRCWRAADRAERSSRLRAASSADLAAVSSADRSERSSRLRAASSSFDRGMIESRCPQGCCNTRVATLVQFTKILGRTQFWDGHNRDPFYMHILIIPLCRFCPRHLCPRRSNIKLR